MSDRADSIVQHFKYLLTEYRFQVVRKVFDPEAMGNSVVIFESPWIGIEVVIDRNQVLMALGDPLDPRKQWFELSDFLAYYAPSVENIYLFAEKTAENTWDDAVDTQLSRLAGLLRQYCEPLLQGEPLNKDEIRKLESIRRAEILRGFNQDPGSPTN